MLSKATNLVQGIRTVVSLPSIYMRLTKVINQRISSAKDIGKIVSDDPGLTARLLRVVNSAYFGFPQKIETVSHAVTIIGTQQLVDLALATSVIKVFKKIPQDIVDMESFWKHSLACGVFARVLAGQRRETNVERYFVAGLLHDIGEVIILTKNSEQARQALDRCKKSGELLHEVEEKIMGYNHAEVGFALLKTWNLSSGLQEAVGYHHHPQQATKSPLEAASVHVAEIMAIALQLGSSGEDLVPPLDPKAWNSLNLPANISSFIIDEVERQYYDIVDIIL